MIIHRLVLAETGRFCLSLRGAGRRRGHLISAEFWLLTTVY